MASKVWSFTLNNYDPNFDYLSYFKSIKTLNLIKPGKNVKATIIYLNY